MGCPADAKRIIDGDDRYVSPSYTRSYPLVAKTGRGIVVTDVDGNEFFDFSAGIAVTSTGHCHPEVVAAIREAALVRFRPIIMTTLAAMLGALPIALGNGAGAELRQPLGITIVGGLLVSQVLTLFTTPVIYIYLDRLRNWRSGHGKAKDAQAQAQAGPPGDPQPEASPS